MVRRADAKSGVENLLCIRGELLHEKMRFESTYIYLDVWLGQHEPQRPDHARRHDSSEKLSSTKLSLKRWQRRGCHGRHHESSRGKQITVSGGGGAVSPQGC